MAYWLSEVQTSKGLVFWTGVAIYSDDGIYGFDEETGEPEMGAYQGFDTEEGPFTALTERRLFHKVRRYAARRGQLHPLGL